MSGKIGSMDRTLIFEKLVKTKDESNGVVTETWVYDFDVRCELMAVSSREYFDAQRRNAEMTFLWRIRHREGIDPAEHRTLFALNKDASPIDYQVCNIFPPRPDRKRRWMFVEGKQFS